MSKKIIIDGINVSECEFYEEMRELPDNLNGGYYIQHCYCCLQGDNYCICNKNPECYYKQLKRLQAENERLKEEIDKLGIKHENYCNTLYWDMKNQYDRYKVAIEKIRELNLFSLNNSREKIAKINEIVSEVLK